MIATILDTRTGLIGTKQGVRSWEWAENNYSCDCNRNLWEADDNPGICKGCTRFLVIKAEFNDPEDYEYSLVELNEEYPVELLQLHGIL